MQTAAAEWLSDLKLPSGERHHVLAEMMIAAIRSRKVPPGTRLPTHRELAQRLNTSVSTVTRTYRELMRRGVVEATVGRGTFVASGAAAMWKASLTPPAQDADAPLDDLNLPVLHRGYLTDLSLNSPLPSISRRCVELGLSAVARTSNPASISNHQSAVGSLRHREAGQKWLQATGIRTAGHELVVVPGSQSALTAILLALCGTGGTILTEELSWPGLLSLASALKVRVVSVKTDGEGIVPDDLKTVLRTEDARLLYTMPTLHNPTGLTTGLKRRKAIAQIAKARNILIVEDDAYGFATSKRPQSYLTLAPERTLYVTSLSKPLTPALRIAYLVAPSPIIGKVVSVLRSTTLMTSPIIAEIATQLIESGQAHELARAQVSTSVRRHAIARAIGIPTVQGASTESMHLWMPLGPHWRTQDFVARAMPIGVSVSPGTVFSATPGFDPQGVRICLNAVESEEILAAALKKLVALRGQSGFGTPFF
jgi:DNA-binding transcriptional MocR family regulator